MLYFNRLFIRKDNINKYKKNLKRKGNFKIYYLRIRKKT